MSNVSESKPTVLVYAEPMLAGSMTFIQRHFFEAHDSTCQGCWDIEIPPGSGHWYPAAHHLVDYFKIWDMPADIKVRPYPH